MPAVSDLLRTTQNFRNQLLADEQAAAGTITDYYQQAVGNAQGQLDNLLGDAQATYDNGGDLKTWQIGKAQQIQRLIADLQGEIEHWSAVARGVVDQARKSAMETGRAFAQVAMRDTVPPGVAWNFSAVAPEAVQAQIGRMEPGSPVHDLFETLGPEAAASIQQTLVNGMTTGTNPRQVAEEISTTTEVPLQRALTIARTEMLSSYRTAAIMNYQDNSDVVDGWIWSADLSVNTCGDCLAMNGSYHSNDEYLDSHANCRCSPVPATNSWQDILSNAGIDSSDIDLSDLPDTSADILTGEDWFAKQTPEIQRTILGPSKAALYQTGQIKLADLVAHTYDPAWGPGIREKSLAELGFTAQDVKAAQQQIDQQGPQTADQSAAAQAHIAALQAQVAALQADLQALSYQQLGAMQRAQIANEQYRQRLDAARASYGADETTWPDVTRQQVDARAARASTTAQALASVNDAIAQRNYEIGAAQNQATTERLGTLNVSAIDAITTITGLRDWLATNLPDVQVALAGATNVEQLRAVIKALARFADTYPDAAAKLRLIGSFGDPTISAIVEHYYPDAPSRRGKLGRLVDLAEVDPTLDGGGLLLNGRYLSSPKAWNDLAAAQRADNWWQEGATDIGYVVTHEAGHEVQFYFATHPDPAVRQAYADWMAQVRDHMTPEEAISGYALISADEMFAEAFTVISGYGPARLSDLSYVKSLRTLLDGARASSEAFADGKPYPEMPAPPVDTSLQDALAKAQSVHANLSGETLTAYQRMQDRYAQVVREQGADAANHDPQYQQLRNDYLQAQMREAEALRQVQEAQQAMRQQEPPAAPPEQEFAVKKPPTTAKPTLSPEEKAAAKATKDAQKAEALAVKAEAKAQALEGKSLDTAQAKVDSAQARLDKAQAKMEAASIAGPQRTEPANPHEATDAEKAAVVARRAELDAQYGDYSVLSMRKQLQTLYEQYPELERAIDVHLMGKGATGGSHLAELSAESIAAARPFKEVGVKNDTAQYKEIKIEGDRQQRAQDALAALKELTEWSLLHYPGLNDDGTITLFHGSEGKASTDERIGRYVDGAYRQGTSFADRLDAARTFAVAKAKGLRTIIQADVPISQISTWYRMIEGPADQREFVVDGGPLRNVVQITEPKDTESTAGAAERIAKAQSALDTARTTLTTAQDALARAEKAATDARAAADTARAQADAAQGRLADAQAQADEAKASHDPTRAKWMQIDRQGATAQFTLEIAGMRYFAKVASELTPLTEAAQDFVRGVGADDLFVPVRLVERGGTRFELTPYIDGATGDAALPQALKIVSTEEITRSILISYLIGDTDGHAGNYVVTADGHLWHIDYNAFDQFSTFDDSLALVRYGFGDDPRSYRTQPIDRAYLDMLMHHTEDLRALLDSSRASATMRQIGVTGDLRSALERRIAIIDQLAHMEHPTLGDLADLANAGIVDYKPAAEPALEEDLKGAAAVVASTEPALEFAAKLPPKAPKLSDEETALNKAAVAASKAEAKATAAETKLAGAQKAADAADAKLATAEAKLDTLEAKAESDAKLPADFEIKLQKARDAVDAAQAKATAAHDALAKAQDAATTARAVADQAHASHADAKAAVEAKGAAPAPVALKPVEQAAEAAGKITLTHTAADGTVRIFTIEPDTHMGGYKVTLTMPDGSVVVTEGLFDQKAINKYLKKVTGENLFTKKLADSMGPGMAQAEVYLQNGNAIGYGYGYVIDTPTGPQHIFVVADAAWGHDPAYHTAELGDSQYSASMPNALHFYPDEYTGTWRVLADTPGKWASNAVVATGLTPTEITDFLQSKFHLANDFSQAAQDVAQTEIHNKIAQSGGNAAEEITGNQITYTLANGERVVVADMGKGKGYTVTHYPADWTTPGTTETIETAKTVAQVEKLLKARGVENSFGMKSGSATVKLPGGGDALIQKTAAGYEVAYHTSSGSPTETAPEPFHSAQEVDAFLTSLGATATFTDATFKGTGKTKIDDYNATHASGAHPAWMSQGTGDALSLGFVTENAHPGDGVGHYVVEAGGYHVDIIGKADGSIEITSQKGAKGTPQTSTVTDLKAAHDYLTALGITDPAYQRMADFAAQDAARYLGPPTPEQQVKIDQVQARVAELDAKYGDYSDAAARALLQDLRTKFPELDAAISKHLGGGKGTHLSAETVAKLIREKTLTSAEKLAAAREVMAQVSEITEWSLLHSPNVTREGTVLLFHGANGNDVAKWDERIKNGKMRDGTPFTTSWNVAVSFAERGLIVVAQMPVENVETWWGIRGDRQYAYEEEYTVGSGAVSDYTFIQRGQVVHTDIYTTITQTVIGGWVETTVTPESQVVLKYAGPEGHTATIIVEPDTVNGGYQVTIMRDGQPDEVQSGLKSKQVDALVATETDAPHLFQGLYDQDLKPGTKPKAK